MWKGTKDLDNATKKLKQNRREVLLITFRDHSLSGQSSGKEKIKEEKYSSSAKFG